MIHSVGHFRVSKTPTLKTRLFAKRKTFPVTMSFICMRKKKKIFISMASLLALYHNGGLRTSSKATVKQETKTWNLFGKIAAK